jgi:hypothetical protein
MLTFTIKDSVTGEVLVVMTYKEKAINLTIAEIAEDIARMLELPTDACYVAKGD